MFALFKCRKSDKGKKLKIRKSHLFQQLRCVKGYTGYVGSGSKLFKKLGAIVTEIDISTEAYSTIQSVFEDADVIYFTGGNSFFLIDQLRKTGNELLKKRKNWQRKTDDW